MLANRASKWKVCKCAALFVLGIARNLVHGAPRVYARFKYCVGELSRRRRRWAHVAHSIRQLESLLWFMPLKRTCLPSSRDVGSGGSGSGTRVMQCESKNIYAHQTHLLVCARLNSLAVNAVRHIMRFVCEALRCVGARLLSTMGIHAEEQQQHRQSVGRSGCLCFGFHAVHNTSPTVSFSRQT